MCTSQASEMPASQVVKQTSCEKSCSAVLLCSTLALSLGVLGCHPHRSCSFLDLVADFDGYVSHPTEAWGLQVGPPWHFSDWSCMQRSKSQYPTTSSSMSLQIGQGSRAFCSNCRSSSKGARGHISRGSLVFARAQPSRFALQNSQTNLVNLEQERVSSRWRTYVSSAPKDKRVCRARADSAVASQPL